jgi:hypothetical protein
MDAFGTALDPADMHPARGEVDGSANNEYLPIKNAEQSLTCLRKKIAASICLLL